MIGLNWNPIRRGRAGLVHAGLLLMVRVKEI